MPYSIFWSKLPKEPVPEPDVAELVEYEAASARVPLDGDLPAEFAATGATDEDREAALRWILELNANEPLGWMGHIGHVPDENCLRDLRHIASVLREAGSDAAEIAYDGGGDEGFAHFDAALDDGHRVGAAAVVAAVAKGPLGELGDGPPDLYAAADPAARWAKMSARKRAAERLEFFATELATTLFGDGWGTGDYATEGWFRADLTSGRLTDLTLEPPPTFYSEAENRWEAIAEDRAYEERLRAKESK